MAVNPQTLVQNCNKRLQHDLIQGKMRLSPPADMSQYNNRQQFIEKKINLQQQLQDVNRKIHQLHHNKMQARRSQDLLSSPKGHAEKVKKFNIQRKQRQRVRQRWLQQRDQQFKKESLKLKQKEKQKKCSQADQYKASLERKAKQDAEKREKRHKQWQQNAKVQKALHNKKPLHLVIQQNYQKVKQKQRYIQQVKLKKLLNQKINPIQFDQIKRHAYRYDRQRQTKSKRSSQGSLTMRMQYRKSQYYKQYQESVSRRKNHFQEQKKKESDRIQKLRHYISHVKQSHYPRIDPSKRQQLQQMRSSTSVRQSVDPRQQGLQFLQVAKSMHIKNRTNQRYSQSQASQKEGINKKQITTGQIKKPINYLQQLRNGKVLAPKKTSQQIIQQVMIRNDLNPQQKKKMILKQTAKLQTEARRRQQIGKVTKRGMEGADQLLLDSLKAKMSLLN